MAIVSVGIDLAKNTLAVHSVDESGKPALVRPSVSRAKQLELIASRASAAYAINEAVARPNMRFVPVKSLDQQGQRLVHRARLGFVEQRTATLNRIRGLLPKLGYVGSTL